MAKKTKIAEDTPLIKQFFSIKAQYPETILLYRVGDFYETYSEDAVVASKVLGIIQTKKSNGSKGDIEMAGFPHHALNTYLPKLVRAGHKVAICDQLEDPKKTKKLVKRGVTEIVTPGVAFNEEILDQKENNFLCGIYTHKKEFGVAFLDVTTGDFHVAQGEKSYIESLLGSMEPKELVIPRSKSKELCEQFGNKFYISMMDEWAFVFDSAENKLKKQFKVNSLSGFGVDNSPLGICAAGALLAYLEHTCHTDLDNICSISRIDKDEFVWMDEFTIRNLEIFRDASAGKGKALINVLDNCKTPMGARLLRKYLFLPEMDIDEINARYSVVRYFTENKEKLYPIRDMLSNIGDMERILSKTATGKILPREILQLCKGLEQNAPIQHICHESSVLEIDNMINSISNCDNLIEKIRQTLKSDPAAAVGKGKVIADGVNEELDRIRAISKNSKNELLRIQQREIEETGITSLKIGFNSVFGYYLEVRNTFKNNVPEDWIRKQTLVNAERYITPELKDYEMTILTADEKALELEMNIYQDLVRHIQSKISEIQHNCNIISRLDVLTCFSFNALQYNYHEPKISTGKALKIKAGRHPVIETMMPIGQEYIANDLFLDDKTQQIIILTGPNMSGKSALLRQTALIVLMAQIGSFVPADSAEIGLCDKIFTRVGASDNISKGESTFMVEMLETSTILHNISSRSLILLDEIGRGTSTYDGMSIARGIVEFIHNRGKGAKTLFATHYHELNDLEKIYPRIKNFHIEVKEANKEIIFLRLLKEGGVASSFGIHVARMAGMPEPVLESAEKTLSRLEKGNAEDLSKLGKKEKDGSIQLSLFQLDDPLLSSLRDKLKTTDLNNITPMQAFDLLRDMKNELGL